MTQAADRSNPCDDANNSGPHVESLSAVTLVTGDLARAMRFYAALGFELHCGDANAKLVSYAAGDAYLNLMSVPGARAPRGWGRVILYVSDVDAFYARALACGLQPEGAPRNADWGERYFHLRDPDGHELSFAQPLPPAQATSSSG
jgi:catechol 2,3-dioxygenase-like lactoylglutathione lyase family enzyme